MSGRVGLGVGTCVGGVIDRLGLGVGAGVGIWRQRQESREACVVVRHGFVHVFRTEQTRGRSIA